MSVDVDAVNERLNGLVNLLKAVGVEGGDSGGSGNGKGEGGLPNARQLNDDQIEAIIKKLQQAQAEAPQIIAALEAHAEARSLNGTKDDHAAPPAPSQNEEEGDEEDDEFDEDANYPMVGHGVSDDISVVSDLTTPTVLTGVPVPEEEHYKETLPPMIVGGVGEPSMIISAPKRKNLVSQVRPGALPPPGSRKAPPGAIGMPGSRGAAAARRKNYQDTMAKLQENPGQQRAASDATGHHHHSGSEKKSKKSSSKSTSGDTPGKSHGKKKKSKDSSASQTGSANASAIGEFSMNTGEWATDSQGWNSFENKPKGGKAPTVIDNDGFLVGESFDPFASGNPFKSSAGDLEFGTATNDGTKKKKKKKASSADSENMQGSFSNKDEKKSRPSEGKQRRRRRASLAV